jgi:zinc transport system substrate-binding protein
MYQLRLLACIWLLCTSLVTQAATPGIVVSIKPLHSLVAAISEGVSTPTLLLDGAQSPHHTSLRPSQRGVLAEADIVFWIGPTLEGFLPRVFASLSPSTHIISMLDAPGIELLPARDNHGDATQHTDPHLWLSTRNATAMARFIAAQLGTLDPAHAAHYQANLTHTLQRINALQDELRARIGTPQQALLSYHDAYQYFEHEFSLHSAGMVTTAEDAAPGARHLRELRQRMTAQNIRCLVYEQPTRPALIDTLTLNTTIRVAGVDSLGVTQRAGADAWFAIMRQLATDFHTCLSP